MYGYVVQTKRTKIIREEFCGMPLMRLELSPRKQRNLPRVMRKHKIHRLLSEVSTQRLWQEKALDAALLLLALHGHTPSQSTVEFHSLRGHSEGLLLPFLSHVRRISLTGVVDEQLLWRLQREHGVSACHAPGDLTICLSPIQRPLQLPLYEPIPQIPELALFVDAPPIPPQCPVDGLLAATLNQGRLRVQDIKIRAIFS